MPRTITVRHVQRFASRGAAHGAQDVANALFGWRGFAASYGNDPSGRRAVEVWITADGAVRWVFSPVLPPAVAARWQRIRTLQQLADSLAARYGAQQPWREALARLLAGIAAGGDGNGEGRDAARAASRPKETDAVDGSTGSGDLTHGGDGASGEVPDAAPRAAPGHDPRGAPAGHPPPAAPEAPVRSGDDRPHPVEVDLDAIDRRIAACAPPETDGRAHAPPPRSGASHARRAIRRGGRGTGARRGGGPGDSGVRLAQRRARESTLVQRCQEALRQLVSAGADETGPRWDAAHLARRLLSGRPLAPARRAEMGRPAILVVADVSSSCSAFAEPACAVASACGALGVPGADVLIVTINNPFVPLELEVNGDLVPLPPDLWGRDVAVDHFAAFLARRWNVSSIVHLGDGQECDSIASWARRPEIERVIWLDNYLSSRIVPRIDRRAQEVLPDADTQAKITRVIGCGTAAEMVVGLHLAVEAVVRRT
jgi:hypothetical protein